MVLPPVTVFFPLFALLRSFKCLPEITFGLSRNFEGYNAYNGRTLAVYVNFKYGTMKIANYHVVSDPHRGLVTIVAGYLIPYGKHFPSLVDVVAVFFTTNDFNVYHSMFATTLLALIVMFDMLLAFISSHVLSGALLHKMPSSFALRVPPCEGPRILGIVIHSVFSEALFILKETTTITTPTNVVV